eukprot:3422192-Pleurochrysis_carterae.AAC.1
MRRGSQQKLAVIQFYRFEKAVGACFRFWGRSQLCFCFSHSHLRPSPDTHVLVWLQKAEVQQLSIRARRSEAGALLPQRDHGRCMPHFGTRKRSRRGSGWVPVTWFVFVYLRGYFVFASLSASRARILSARTKVYLRK